MELIDNKKAYEFILQTWIIDYLKKVNFFTRATENCKVEVAV